MKLTRKEAIKISKDYNLGNVVKCSLIKGGVVNFNYILTTDKGEFIVRIISSYKKKSEKSPDLIIPIYLSKNNFPYKVPIPLKNAKGKFLSRSNGKSLWIYKKLPGKNPKKLNKQQIREMARALSILQKYLKKVKIKGKKKMIFGEKELFEKYVKTESIKVKNKIDKLMVDNSDYLVNISKRLNNIIFKEGMQWIHSDVDRSNVLYKGNKIIAIIDFDNLHIWNRLADTQYTFQECCFEGAIFDKNKEKIFLEEYNKLNPLTKKEKELLYSAVMWFNVYVIWWFYSGMKKNIGKKYHYIKVSIERIKTMDKMLNSN